VVFTSPPRKVPVLLLRSLTMVSILTGLPKWQAAQGTQGMQLVQKTKRGRTRSRRCRAAVEVLDKVLGRSAETHKLVLPKMNAAKDTCDRNHQEDRLNDHAAHKPYRGKIEGLIKAMWKAMWRPYGRIKGLIRAYSRAL